MTQTETENQSELGLPLWAICPGCGKERRVRDSGEMAHHRRYIPEYGIMEYCDGSYGRPGKVTIRSGDRKDKGKVRGRYGKRS